MTVSSIAAALRVAHDFFAAIEAGRWDDAAGLVDLELAIAFRETELAFILAWFDQQKVLATMQQEGEGAVGWAAPGRVDAAYLAKYGAMPLRNIANVQTVADLAALSPHAFVAACLQARNEQITVPGGEQLRLTRHVIGGVHEGNAIVHVLFRMQGPEVLYTDPLSVDVIRLRASERGWQMDPTSFRFGLASAHPFVQVGDIGDDEEPAPLDPVPPDA